MWMQFQNHVLIDRNRRSRFAAAESSVTIGQRVQSDEQWVEGRESPLAEPAGVVSQYIEGAAGQSKTGGERQKTQEGRVEVAKRGVEASGKRPGGTSGLGGKEVCGQRG
jgi:hypothetical protein